LSGGSVKRRGIEMKGGPLVRRSRGSQGRLAHIKKNHEILARNTTTGGCPRGSPQEGGPPKNKMVCEGDLPQRVSHTEREIIAVGNAGPTPLGDKKRKPTSNDVWQELKGFGSRGGEKPYRPKKALAPGRKDSIP